MEIIPVSKFKATCLAIIERVRKTRETVLVTKRGVPVAQLLPPPPPPPRKKSAFGCMAGTAILTGDLVKPLPAKGWEALQ